MYRCFDYHATGKQNFIDRVIVVLAMIPLFIPFVNVFAILALLVTLPWLLNRAMVFNARMTSFSGVRFGFRGSYGRALLVFMICPILVALTLYTAFPFLARATHRYYVNNHSYGTARFGFGSGIGRFYKTFGMALLWSVAVFVTGFVLLGGGSLFAEMAETARYGQTAPSIS